MGGMSQSQSRTITPNESRRAREYMKDRPKRTGLFGPIRDLFEGHRAMVDKPQGYLKKKEHKKKVSARREKLRAKPMRGPQTIMATEETLG